MQPAGKLARATCTLALAVLGAAAASPAAGQGGVRADSAALVTTLGSDTLTLERWVRTGDRITAEAVVRSPRTTYRRYVLELGPDGNMRRFEERTFDPADVSRAVRTEVFEAAAGGWRRSVSEGDSTRAAQVTGDATALPFVDLVHWPMELVLARAARGPLETQPLLSGSRALPFRVARTGADQVTLTHPLRGPSVARVDAAGRLLALDASQTTRKVQVARVRWVDVEDAARRWAAADRAGRSMGELSGRGRADVTVAGAHIVVDYGTPARRGRDIFGAVVPWGQLWRTGANRATHFTTDHPLVLGDPNLGATLAVPAGEYTLFSIPEANGGWLIVSSQTGQAGTAYDPARDLGRVRMRIGKLAEPVEVFTIRVEPGAGSAGTLALEWDRTQLAVPFTVGGS